MPQCVLTDPLASPQSRDAEASGRKGDRPCRHTDEAAAEASGPGIDPEANRQRECFAGEMSPEWSTSASSGWMTISIGSFPARRGQSTQKPTEMMQDALTAPATAGLSRCFRLPPV